MATTATKLDLTILAIDRKRANLLATGVRTLTVKITMWKQHERTSPTV